MKARGFQVMAILQAARARDMFFSEVYRSRRGALAAIWTEMADKISKEQ